MKFYISLIFIEGRWKENKGRRKKSRQEKNVGYK